MGIKIIKPGLLTTIQDTGRFGYQKYGFSPSGTLDQKALKIANLLVGNPVGEAALEMTLHGAEIEFTSAQVIAITGGDFKPVLNGSPVPFYAAVSVKRGDILKFGFAITGCRCYLAFAGGLSVPKIMGSKSTNLKCKIGGYHGRKLVTGDVISFSSPVFALPKMEKRQLDYTISKTDILTLHVIPGPQDDYFTQKGQNTFFKEIYTVTNQSDRMGYRLDGPAIAYKESVDIISDGIPLGAVQVPSNGKPIIMLADRQTTGGYAKIGTVISTDISKLAQCKMGDKIQFSKISTEEAQQLYCAEQKKMEDLLMFFDRLRELRPVAARISRLFASLDENDK